MSKNHDVTLLETDMQEICDIVKEMESKSVDVDVSPKKNILTILKTAYQQVKTIWK
jgi:exonuclease VII small subunit